MTARVSWSAIFAGVAVSTALWVMLHLLGMGAGLTAIDPDDAGTLKGAGIGTGVWSLIAPILALFLGGLVTGRVAGVFDRPLSAIHGSVVWALTTTAGVALLVVGLSGLIGTTARMAGGAVEGTVGMVARGAAGLDAADGQRVMDAIGLSSDDLMSPINRELREQGKPAVTAAQLQAATRDVVSDAVKQGRLDTAALVRSIADHTALSQPQAADLAAQIEQRWDTKKQQLVQVAETATTGALQAAESTGKGLLIAVASMLLSLIAAGGGAILGSTWWRGKVSVVTNS